MDNKQLKQTAPVDPPTEESRWAGESGQRWLANADGFEALLRPVTGRVLDAAKLQPRHRVTDIGCGAGSLTFAAAERIGTEGSVVGVDISSVLIGEARRRAAQRPGSHVEFILADAATLNPPAERMDRMISRFGVMFFSHPYAAFTNLRRWLKPGGQLAFSCWAPLQENPWMGLTREVLATAIDVPPMVARAPGPYAFDDPAYVREILTSAGFSNIHVESWKTFLTVGERSLGPEGTAAFLIKSMSLAQKLRAMAEPVRKHLEHVLAERLAAFATPEGMMMPASMWIVSATA